MKILIWTLFTLLALGWTGGTWLSATLVQALTEALASGSTLEGAQAVQAWQVPAWLLPWVDGAWVSLVQGGVAWLLEAFDAVGPQVAPVLGWLVPLLWGVWALGLLLLLALAVGLHVLVGRTAAPPAVTAA
jgi:hypothetical protein